MNSRRSMVTSLGMTLACWGLMLALGAPAEAGGRGGHRGHASGGHHGSYRSHGAHASVGYYRGPGRAYRSGGHHGSYSHRTYGVYGSYAGGYRYGYRSRSYVYPGYRSPSYRPYLRSPAIYRGYRTHLPYPVYYAPAYGGTVYLDAEPAYGASYVAPPAAPQPQTIYIVIQPPGEAAPVAGTPAAGEAPAAPAYEPEPPAVRSGGEPGRVHLRVEPPDASVYLDDDPLGTGEDIARLEEPLSLSSGVHVIEVLHPAYRPQRLVFGVPAAGELRVEIDLDGDHRGRKALVKDLDQRPFETGG